MPGETKLLSIQPSEVKFPFELKKQISCTLHLVNTTDKDIAFKVKTTAPKNYFVRPTSGVLSPNCSADVVITMQARREAPPNMQCKDKFLVQSVITPVGTNATDVPQELFHKGPGNDVREAKLRVQFVAPQQDSSVGSAEPTEEFMSPRLVPAVDSRGSRHYMAHDAVSRDVIELKAKLIEARAELAKMKAEHDVEVEKSHRLQQQLTNMVAQIDRRKADSNKGNSQALEPQQAQFKFPILFVFVIGLLGVFVGRVMTRRGLK